MRVRHLPQEQYGGDLLTALSVGIRAALFLRSGGFDFLAQTTDSLPSVV